jgi:hypothetical protein
MFTILTKPRKILHYWYHNILMYIVNYFIFLFFNKFLCQLPEYGEVIAPKHAGTV